MSCALRSLESFTRHTLPFVLAFADKGWRAALSEDPHLLAGLNVLDGKVTCQPVAEAQGLEYTPAHTLLERQRP